MTAIESSPGSEALRALLAAAPIERDRDQFTRELLRELARVLEDTVGLDEAEGFISLVGGRIARMMDDEYRRVAGVDSFDDAAQVAELLVDLKRRIQGGFSIESVDAESIVLVNTDCPFGHYVAGQESLCMMTSNVFGRIAADNLGYARVEITDAIARGQDGCRVVVHLSEGGAGREYFN